MCQTTKEYRTGKQDITTEIGYQSVASKVTDANVNAYNTWKLNKRNLSLLTS